MSILDAVRSLRRTVTTLAKEPDAKVRNKGDLSEIMRELDLVQEDIQLQYHTNFESDSDQSTAVSIRSAQNSLKFHTDWKEAYFDTVNEVLEAARSSARGVKHYWSGKNKLSSVFLGAPEEIMSDMLSDITKASRKVVRVPKAHDRFKIVTHDRLLDLLRQKEGHHAVLVICRESNEQYRRGLNPKQNNQVRNARYQSEAFSALDPLYPADDVIFVCLLFHVNSAKAQTSSLGRFSLVDDQTSDDDDNDEDIVSAVDAEVPRQGGPRGKGAMETFSKDKWDLGAPLVQRVLLLGATALTTDIDKLYSMMSMTPSTFKLLVTQVEGRLLRISRKQLLQALADNIDIQSDILQLVDASAVLCQALILGEGDIMVMNQAIACLSGSVFELRKHTANADLPDVDAFLNLLEWGAAWRQAVSSFKHIAPPEAHMRSNMTMRSFNMASYDGSFQPEELSKEIAYRHAGKGIVNVAAKYAEELMEATKLEAKMRR